MNLQPWASKENILHELIQPGKYMNTFCFIRWPRSRLHGHFHFVPTLKFTDASKLAMGKQRLQWQSLRVGRFYLSFQRDSPLHPTNSIPMDGVGGGVGGGNRRTNKVQLKTLVLLWKTQTIRCLFVACCGGGRFDMSEWAVAFQFLILSQPSASYIMYGGRSVKKVWKLFACLTMVIHLLTGKSLICVSGEGA